MTYVERVKIITRDAPGSAGHLKICKSKANIEERKKIVKLKKNFFYNRHRKGAAQSTESNADIERCTE